MTWRGIRAVLLAMMALTMQAAETGREVRECARCHAAEAKHHPGTSMAHALESITECGILRTHPVLTVKRGEYAYRIERKDKKSLYTVSGPAGEETFTLLWAFGLADAGQTYVFEKDGVLRESRVSFYRSLDGLDWTMGAANTTPANLMEAAGRKMGPQESGQCFGCHATNAVRGQDVAFEGMTPGVQCERCHGATDAHLEAVKTGKAGGAMKKLGAEDAETISNFCGQCHRTWAEIAGKGPMGVGNVRFQPYRLANSKCYDVEDKRISCVGCHNPHQELDRDDGHYDAKCQGCHGGGHNAVKEGAKACKVAQAGCVGCHMPRVEIPGSHFRFTDHQIRIARANDAYPN